ncbi:MAG: hypothetical protein M3O36_15060 [Myxococcota bacterium]|nr:hypothetical protein [Myxococcota bacterium]
MVRVDGASVSEELDTLRIDWSDFNRASVESRDLARRIGADKSALRRLVFGIERNPELLAKCERHHLLDYFVLHDALDRGFRVRLHMSTENHLERPHDHRFSFSSYIVRGHYEHTLHLITPDPYADQTDRAAEFISIQNPDPTEHVHLGQIQTLSTRIESAGSSYSLHHSAVHTTVTAPGTVSVFVRGPAEKASSLIFDVDTESYWWRFGQEQESPERRKQKQMSVDDYLRLRERLVAMGTI